MLGDYSSDIEERTAAAVRELRETARDQLYKIGLPGKWILGDYFQEKRTRLGNCCDRVSVFGSKSCVFLAVCGQIRQKFWGTYEQRSS